MRSFAMNVKKHPRTKCPKLKKNLKKKAMMDTWKDLDEEQEGVESWGRKK